MRWCSWYVFLSLIQIEDYSMVSFLPLDLTDEDSIAMALSCIANIVQYGEDEEPAEPKDMDEEEEAP